VSSCDCLSYYFIHDSQDEIEFDVDTVVKIMTIIIHVVLQNTVKEINYIS
jgi:hypothetical protein